MISSAGNRVHLFMATWCAPQWGILSSANAIPHPARFLRAEHEAADRPEWPSPVLSDLDTTNEARRKAEHEAATLALQLNVTKEALIGFLKILDEKAVPPEQVTDKLIEITNRFDATRQRLASLDFDDPARKALIDQAQGELEHGHTDAASALLQRVEEAELTAAAHARALSQQAASVEREGAFAVASGRRFVSPRQRARRQFSPRRIDFDLELACSGISSGQGPDRDIAIISKAG
jgi:hypothetical protein